MCFLRSQVRTEEPVVCLSSSHCSRRRISGAFVTRLRSLVGLIERYTVDCSCGTFFCNPGTLWVRFRGPSLGIIVTHLSIIVTTAVFSTCGMGIIVFSLAALLSLPKQLITVYLGVVIRNSNNGNESTKSRIISDVVLVISFLVTVAAAIWIHAQMAKVKPEVLRDRRRARARKEWEMHGGGAHGQSVQHLTSRSRLDVDNESVFNPADEDDDGYRPTGNVPYSAVPRGSTHALNPPVSVQPQRWDAHGRAIPLLDAKRHDSADVQWDPRGDGGTTLGASGRPPALYSGARSTPPPEVPSQQPQARSEAASQNQPSPPTSDGPSTPYYSPRARSPPQAPSQPPIPLSVPRYQLHDGPSPAANSSVGLDAYDPQPDTVPRIPPPPGSR